MIMARRIMAFVSICITLLLCSTIDAQEKCKCLLIGDEYQRTEMGARTSVSGLHTVDAYVDYNAGRDYVLVEVEERVVGFMNESAKLYDSLLSLYDKFQGPSNGKVVEEGGAEGKAEYRYYYDNMGRLMADEIAYKGDVEPYYYRHVVDYQGNRPATIENVRVLYRNGVYEIVEGETWYLKYDSKGCLEEEMKIYWNHADILYENISHKYERFPNR